MMDPVPKSRFVFVRSPWIITGIFIHILFLFSVLSEPFSLEHGVNLHGTRSHPQEQSHLKGFLDPLFHDTDRVPRGLDFFSIYQAGRNFLKGDSVFYGVRVHSLGENALVVPYFSGFRYLPVYAYTYGVILNILPPWYSYWAWLFCVELLLIFNLYLIGRLKLASGLKPLLMFMWLAYSPYYIELHIGQQSMVTVTLIHLVAFAHLNKSPNQRDCSYVLSVLWKINTILFIPIWVKFKRFKTISSLIFLTVALSLPYFLLVEGSFPEFVSYFKHKFIAIGPNSLGFWAMTATLLQRFGVHHSTIKLILTSWTLIMLTFCSLVTLLPRRIRFQNLLAMWICIYFLTYQYVWEHHYVLMLPVFTLLFDNSKLRRFVIPVWLMCAIPTPYLFLNNGNLPMPQIEWSLLQVILYHSWKVIPVLLLFSITAIVELKTPLNAKSSDPQWDILGIVFKKKEHLET